MNMDFKFYITAVLVGVIAGIAAYAAATLLQGLLTKRRMGTPITWTNQCGEKIEPKETKLPWLYIIIACLLMICPGLFCGVDIQLLYVFLELTVFLFLSLADIKYRLIPNLAVLGIVIIHVLWLFVPSLYGVEPEIGKSLLYSAIGLAVGFAVFFGGTLMTGGKVGMGDVKLAMAIGFMLGWHRLIIAIALSGVVMLPFLFTIPGMNLKERFKQLIPFGPPFSLAAMVVLVASFTPLAAYMPY